MKSRWSAILTSATLLACSGGAPAGPGSAPPVTPPPPTTNPPPAPPPSESRAEPPIGSVANFDIIDDSFVDEDGNHDQEARATVQIGQKVTWTQNGKHTHRVEFSKVPSGAESKDSQDLRPLATWEFRPREAGTYVFFCRYHEYMMDVTITVEDGS